jgi:multisubunit Na+/H+ antiporter MnhF subunit
VSIWLVCCLILTLGAAAPALLLAMRGGPVSRLVGLQQFGAVAVLALMLLAQAVAESAYLIVPLALALLSFAGALVFARLVVPRE